MSGRIVLASNNPHKLDEFRQLLQPVNLDVVSPHSLNLPFDVDEAGSTFEENALIKARALRDISRRVCVADDSGLVVDALGGDPGIRSARYGGPGLSDRDRVRLILLRMTGIPECDRGASFVAAVSVALPDGREAVFRGEVNGTITYEPRGTNGFGYDPIFLYPDFNQTFGEASAGQKALVSHRARALRKAIVFLNELKEQGILD